MSSKNLEAGINKLPAIHPGEILQEEFLEPMDLSRSALAKSIGVTPARINEIANQKRGITADKATFGKKVILTKLFVIKNSLI